MTRVQSTILILVFPNRDAVREDNWEEYKSKGFGVLWPSIDRDDYGERVVTYAQWEFGTGNVYTGDSYDDEAGRPLRHKPGMGIYVSPEGVEYHDARRAQRLKYEDARRAQRQAQSSSDDPASS